MSPETKDQRVRIELYIGVELLRPSEIALDKRESDFTQNFYQVVYIIHSIVTFPCFVSSSSRTS